MIDLYQKRLGSMNKEEILSIGWNKYDSFISNPFLFFF